jgi:hypothetical protein
VWIDEARPRVRATRIDSEKKGHAENGRLDPALWQWAIPQ